MHMIRIGIVGYGNLGKSVEAAIAKNPDMELAAIFSRRPSSSVKTQGNVPIISVSKALEWKHKIDVMILCGGSAADLPEQGPLFAKDFNTVDSFDTHALIPEYFNTMDAIAKANDNLSLVSCGWDPGIFSLARSLFGSILPDGKDYTFWGKGVSQGHSDAIRQIKGVLDARQYTIPIEEALEAARSDKQPELATREKHFRVCYVVAEDDADKDTIRQSIVTMPYYFSDYNTSVTFITAEEMSAKHSSLPHGGFVIRNGKTSENISQVAELSLKLDSNPQFTASVLVAYSRAVSRMKSQGTTGALTVLDIPVSYLSPLSGDDLRKNLL
ncbi:MAG: diaminopimelate dehydrogenase [Saccharofermentanales bacterium]